jgi:hypothetical protein
MDFPRQPAPSAIGGVRRTVRYTAALVWTLGLGVGANFVMFWIVEQLLTRT